MNTLNVFSGGAYSPRDWGQIENLNRLKDVYRKIYSMRKINIYLDPEAYDLAYPGYKGDIEYYVKKCLNKKSVLYLGVGTGRVFLPMIKNHINVVGLDISKEMISALKKKVYLKKNQVICRDIFKARIKANSFDAIIAPYSFFQSFNTIEIIMMLKKVKKWLVPNGVFLTDTFSPFLIPFRKSGLEYCNVKQGNNSQLSIFIEYDHLNQKMKEFAIIKSGKGTKKLLEMDLHYYFPSQILDFFKNAGFESVKIYGDYSESRFSTVLSDVVLYEAKLSSKKTKNSV